MMIGVTPASFDTSRKWAEGSSEIRGNSTTRATPVVHPSSGALHATRAWLPHCFGPVPRFFRMTAPPPDSGQHAAIAGPEKSELAPDPENGALRPGPLSVPRDRPWSFVAPQSAGSAAWNPPRPSSLPYAAQPVRHRACRFADTPSPAGLQYVYRTPEAGELLPRPRRHRPAPLAQYTPAPARGV